MKNKVTRGTRASGWSLILVGAALAGCSAGTDATTLVEVETTLTSGSLGERLETLSGDLSVGSRGSEVSTVQEYLSRYGYFPNSDLQERYPRWEPVVARAPIEPGFFDGRTEEAVRELQARTGLAQTGVVDADTRELLRAPRCGFPEGVPERDEKFAVFGTSVRWPTSHITWRVIGTDEVDLTTTRQVVSAMLQVWGAQTTLTFERVESSSALITVDADELDDPFKAAEGYPPTMVESS